MYSWCWQSRVCRCLGSHIRHSIAVRQLQGQVYFAGLAFFAVCRATYAPLLLATCRVGVHSFTSCLSFACVFVCCIILSGMHALQSATYLGNQGSRVQPTLHPAGSTCVVALSLQPWFVAFCMSLSDCFGAPIHT
jgi:hypothetical protein